MRPAGVPVGDRAQPPRGMRVRLLGQAQVRDRIAAEAVGAALQDQNSGCVPLEVRLDRRPGREEFGIAGAGRQRQVQLGAGAAPVPVSLARAGARIQEFARLRACRRRSAPDRPRSRSTRRRRGARRCRRRRCARARAGAQCSITTPQSLKTQKPAAWSRPAWCSPAIGTKARRALPAHHGIGRDQRRADHVAGGLEHAPNAGVSPPSR